MDRKLIAEEVGEALRVNIETVYRLIKRGELRAIKVGRVWRIPASALAEFEEKAGLTSSKA